MDELEAVRNFYKKYIVEQPSFENGSNLLKACATWIIQQPTKKQELNKKRILSFPDGLENNPNEKFILLIDFYKKYQICHPNYVGAMFLKDDNFYNWCGRRVNHRYEIQPLKALRYLALYGPPKIKKKVKEVLETINKEEICQKIVPMMRQQELLNLDKPTLS